ncbi:MAG TPA: NAD-dependent epimerase/dehydratase family protein [Nitrospiraceae bacterium]|nr:NAD-dependent epimerase/dehydratase family protein [Nitrospiraceae bacterium]
MRILITGSSGFVGGSVGRFAANAGHDILGMGHPCASLGSWPYVQVDIAGADLAPYLNEFAPDVVVHGAGRASVGASFEMPVDDFRAATLTWINLLDSVRRSRVSPRIIFPSSAAVYGNPSRLPVREDAAVNPISPYGYHKAACELLAKEYASCFGLDILVCRIFSLFGVAQRRLLVWELYEQCAGDSSEVWLQGTGKECRDFLHVDDLAAMFLALAEPRSCRPRQSRYLTVNVASGETTPVLSLAERIRDLASPEKEIRCRGREQTGQPLQWSADISLLRSLLPSWHSPLLGARLANCVAMWRQERTGIDEWQRRDGQSSPDVAHMVRDADGTIRYWDEGAKHLYGWTPEEALGQSSHRLLGTIFPRPLRNLEAELYEKGHWEGKLVHKRRDGTEVVVSSRWDLKRDAHDLSPTVVETNEMKRERHHVGVS